jgi:hypothetical protein
LVDDDICTKIGDRVVVDDMLEFTDKSSMGHRLIEWYSQSNLTRNQLPQLLGLWKMGAFDRTKTRERLKNDITEHQKI